MWFEDLEEVDDTYQVESEKTKVTINRLFQIGIVVDQLAKMRVLEFHYDFFTTTLLTEETSS